MSAKCLKRGMRDAQSNLLFLIIFPQSDFLASLLLKNVFKTFSVLSVFFNESRHKSLYENVLKSENLMDCGTGSKVARSIFE